MSGTGRRPAAVTVSWAAGGPLASRERTHGLTRLTWGEPDGHIDIWSSFVSLSQRDLESIDSEPPPPTEPAGVPADALPALIAGRYRCGSLLGRGGMGEVWRAHDDVLLRDVALKVLRRSVIDATQLARFREEAQIGAQLQHPGIVPIHDMGALPDGRLWFTMKVVGGRTLGRLCDEVHRAWRLGLEVSASGYSFRRMLESFLRVCEAVAYAHARGVVHRDLKPANIMVGDFGEVLVLDWGLAKTIGDAAHPELGPVDLGLDRDPRLTQLGAITGTPAYMSPEQARGDSADCGPVADVYALGATLFHLLCERPPRSSRSILDLVMKVATGAPFKAPSEVAQGPEIDAELEQICLRALSSAPEDRHANAGELARDLAAWLDDARQRERAMALVVEADRHRDQAEAFGAEADRLEADGAAALAGLADNAPVDDKEPGWFLQDQSRARRAEALAASTRQVQLLRSALTHARDLPEAHVRLAQVFHARHRAAEATDRSEQAAAAEADLIEHDRTGQFASYLEGTGAVTLLTSPPGAEVRFQRFEERSRRLVPGAARVLGQTPLDEAPLAMGSYLLTLHLAGHDPVRYPVIVDRQEHWHGRPPSESDPLPIWLPPAGTLGTEDCYVPAGWTWSGDPDEAGSQDRVWLGSFVASRFPVTLREYIAFLNALLDIGKRDEAERLQPLVADSDEVIYGRDPDGRFTGIRTDKTGPGWDDVPRDPLSPAVYVDVDMAGAYFAWRGQGDGRPWRLPTELEWLKAARGADRRAYPWGDHFDPTWCRMRSTTTPIMFTSTRSHAVDDSVYGVRGLAGNVTDFAVSPTGQVLRCGGHCGHIGSACRISSRIAETGTGFRYANGGIRGFFPLG